MDTSKPENHARAGDFVLGKLRKRPPESGVAILPPRAATQLHVMPASAGRERRAGPSYDWHGLNRGPVEFLLIQHTFAGRGRLTFEGREDEVGPGQTMLLRVPHDHRYRTVEHEAWDFAYLILHGSEAMRLAAPILKSLGPVTRLPEHALAVFADACMRLIDDPTPAPGHASALAYAVLATLIDAAGASNHGGPSADTPPWIDEIRRFIRSHLDEDLDVPRLARVAGMSRSHFSRTFRAHVGTTPASFVHESRMREAARLLRSTALSVQAVAIRCGYHDPAYFTKAFRRYLYLTPTTFRESGMYHPTRPG